MSDPLPDLRATDADRERVAEHLRGAAAQGQLTFEELDERVEAAYAAKTGGELAPLTTNLRIGRSPRRPPRRARASPSAAGRAARAG